MNHSTNSTTSSQICLDNFQRSFTELNSIYFTRHTRDIIHVYPPGPMLVINQYDKLVKLTVTRMKTKPYIEAYLANPCNGADIERIDTLIAWSRSAETYFSEYDKIQRALYRKHSRILRNRTRQLIKVRDEQRARNSLTIANLTSDTLNELSFLEGIADLPSELQDLIGAYLSAQTIQLCIMDYVINTLPLIMTDSITIFRLKHAEEYIHQTRAVQYRSMFANAISESVILPGMSSRKNHGWEATTHRKKKDYITDIIGQLKVYDYIHNIFIRNPTLVYQLYAAELRREIQFTIKYIHFISRLPSTRKRRNRTVVEPTNTETIIENIE